MGKSSLLTYNSCQVVCVSVCVLQVVRNTNAEAADKCYCI